MSDEEGLRRLADAIRQRRESELRIGIREACARADGISPTTWINVEKGQPATDLTYARIAHGLGWAPGSCQSIRDGGEATLAEEPDDPQREGAEAALRWAETQAPGPLRDALVAMIRATLEQDPGPLPQSELDRQRTIR